MTGSPVEKLVEVTDLHLSYPANIHRANSLRDYFVGVAKDPIGSLFSKKNKVPVLRGVNLTLNQGDRLALLGINGAGKTTLCRVLAGFYTGKGSVHVFGKVRAIFDIMVGIYPELTGRENAEILANLLYPDLTDLKNKIEEALVFTELGQFLGAPFKHYSNGMQTRLCLAVLTLAPAEVLILDEVFEGADQFFRKKIGARVTKMIEQSGAAIFVSHSEETIRRVCNRAALLHDGKIIFDGSMSEGLEFYKNFYESKNSTNS
jgi:ABC-type polysaccharide/polyol phosphate transport system ATPase subunit